jgi:hypothetical protein
MRLSNMTLGPRLYHYHEMMKVTIHFKSGSSYRSGSQYFLVMAPADFIGPFFIVGCNRRIRAGKRKRGGGFDTAPLTYSAAIWALGLAI